MGPRSFLLTLSLSLEDFFSFNPQLSGCLHAAMDSIMTSLPPEVGAFLMKNITVIQIVSMFSIGAWNGLEVGIKTFDCFKRYRGIYFWSMQVASWGILVHAIPAEIRFISQAPNLPMSIPFILGWYAMVTGQAVVLYSRLHLVVADSRHVRWVLWMIIINFFVLNVPMTVLFFEVNLGNAGFATAAVVYDRIQLTGFCLQDLVICGIYIREACRALQPVLEVRGREGRKVIMHLLAVNILVVIMNVLLLVTEYKMHFIQISFKTVVYSIKLKLEFAVLTRLRSLTRTEPCVCNRDPGSPRHSSDINIFDIVSARSRAMHDIENPAIFFQFSGLRRPESIHQGTHDFHQALRETASSEHIPSPTPSNTYAPDPVSFCSDNSNSQSQPRIGSSETRSTVEMSLLESPKS